MPRQRRPASLSYLRLRRQRSGRDLSDIEQFRPWLRPLAYTAQRVAEHRLAERACRPHDLGARGDQFFGALQVDALALFLAQEHLAAACATAERALAGAMRVHHYRGAADDFAGFLVDIAVAAQIAGV